MRNIAIDFDKIEALREKAEQLQAMLMFSILNDGTEAEEMLGRTHKQNYMQSCLNMLDEIHALAENFLEAKAG